MLKIALPNKGSLSDGAVSVVSEAGYDCRRSGKELEKTDAANGVEFFFLRPRDIAVYVARGVIDLGITGRDLNEDAQAPALEVLPLGFGKSSFRYAVPAGSGLKPEDFGGKRIACSYRNIVERDLKKQYTPEMKKLTYSQGKLLIKLVDRECNQSSYEIVQAFLGPARATFYQIFAWTFKASLKKEYDPDGDDRLVERIVRQVETGQL